MFETEDDLDPGEAAGQQEGEIANEGGPVRGEEGQRVADPRVLQRNRLRYRVRAEPGGQPHGSTKRGEIERKKRRREDGPEGDGPGSFGANKEAGRSHSGQQQGRRQRRTAKSRSRGEDILEKERWAMQKTVSGGIPEE